MSKKADWTTHAACFAATIPGQVYDLERDLLDRLSFAKSCNGSQPNPPIYSFDRTQVAR